MHTVVVGGGIVGLASAYYLTQRGVDVTVCEKGSLGAGSTERSVGGIRAQYSSPVNVELSKASLDVWTSFEATFDADIAYRQHGYLFLARGDETAAGLREAVELQNDLGVPTDLLAPADAREFCPALHDEAFAVASYGPVDGYADPHLALQAFGRAAAEAGADVRTKTTVTAINREGETVTGVTAGGERLDADFVVNAAGPWAAHVADLAGVDVPVRPKRRQVIVVDPETPVPETAPLTIDLDTGAHFRPERGGTALVGGHFDEADPDQDPDGFDRTVDFGWAGTALSRAADVAGYFGPDSRVRRGWAGLYAVTPDHHPILEESRPGFVQAVGFSGHGFQHAPATGQLVAELVCDGAASLVDVSALGSDRFESGDLRDERHVA